MDAKHRAAGMPHDFRNDARQLHVELLDEAAHGLEQLRRIVVAVGLEPLAFVVPLERTQKAERVGTKAVEVAHACSRLKRSRAARNSRGLFVTMPATPLCQRRAARCGESTTQTCTGMARRRAPRASSRRGSGTP